MNGRVTALHAAAHCCENSSKLKRYSTDQDSSEQQSQQDNSSNSDKLQIKKKYIEIVRLLCKAGARVNCKDSKNLTPLHYASRSNSEVKI